MKKILFIALSFFSLQSYGQIAFSTLPVYRSTNQDSTRFVALIKSGSVYTNRLILGADINKARLDSIVIAITGKQASGSYAAAVHSHIIADITGLQAALNARLNISDTASMLSNYRHWTQGYLTSLPTHTHDDRYYMESETNALLAAKQDALGYTPVPATRTITINGTTYDLSQNRTWVVSGEGGGSSSWGSITGTLTNQTDLNTALGLKVDKVAGKGLSAEDYTTTEKTKLAGIATGATANSADAQLRDRSTHTGVQAATTITQDATHRFVSDAEKSSWNTSHYFQNLGNKDSLLMPVNDSTTGIKSISVTGTGVSKTVTDSTIVYTVEGGGGGGSVDTSANYNWTGLHTWTNDGAFVFKPATTGFHTTLKFQQANGVDKISFFSDPFLMRMAESGAKYSDYQSYGIWHTNNANVDDGFEVLSNRNVSLIAGSYSLRLYNDGGALTNADVEITTATKGIILRSPDGTRYRVTVANGGTLTVTALP